MLGAGVAGAVESFEKSAAGGFETLESAVGRWSAQSGHAAIHDKHAKSGRQSMHLLGGGQREVVLELRDPLAASSELRFWAERWTARAPFTFRIEARERSGRWEEVYNGDAGILCYLKPRVFFALITF